jgi:hypothetical protein
MVSRAKLVWIGLALLAVGCGKASAPWEIVHPVSGSLTFGGKPIAGAQVTLFPVDSKIPEKVRPTAVTEADGRFRLSTFADSDGAPAGDYRVSVIWHPVVQSPGGAVRGGNQLPPKFASPETSGLTAKVEAGGSALSPIEVPVQ